MDKDKITEHHKIIEAFVNGEAKLQGDHPQEVIDAIDNFMHAGKMMIDVPELEYVPSEYVQNLLKALARYPQYNALVLDLITILKRNGAIQRT